MSTEQQAARDAAPWNGKPRDPGIDSAHVVADRRYGTRHYVLWNAVHGCWKDMGGRMPTESAARWWTYIGPCTPPALRTTPPAAEAQITQEQARKMRDALEPFASIADLVEHTPKRDAEVVYRLPNPAGGYWELERKHFRAARAAFAGVPGA